MDLTFEERVKACAIAAALAEKVSDHFKPDTPTTKAKDAYVQVVEQSYRGSCDDEFVTQARLQWSLYRTGGFWRESVILHVRYRVVQGDEGRKTRLIDLHIPKWEPYQEGNRHVCLRCGPDFVEHEIIVQDTSLHEF